MFEPTILSKVHLFNLLRNGLLSINKIINHLQVQMKLWKLKTLVDAGPVHLGVFPGNKQEMSQRKANKTKKDHKIIFSNWGLVFKTYHQLKKDKSDTNHSVRKKEIPQNNQKNVFLVSCRNLQNSNLTERIVYGCKELLISMFFIFV